ncbi:MAG: NADH-quinone oxidoreductase subunit NuoF [Defluviitaleaceae bacterium]|nr:NADH-quinone oxidoreductase subunit NuoF [Defluviitaleaceae bacterium]
MPEMKEAVEKQIAQHPHDHHILVCASTSCLAGKAGALIDLFQEKVDAAGKTDKVLVVKTGCFGLCAVGPVVIVYPEGIFYEHVDETAVLRIFDEHIMGGEVVKDFVYEEAIVDGKITPFEETSFFKKQLRVALRNCGILDPENINEYIAHDGYQALGKVLKEMQPLEVIDLIKASGLRGRGGAGFSTGTKWGFAAAQPPGQKYVVCNGDEGDPGAFMDRSILEGDPHTVLEAMAICGYAIGASEGYLYVRAEYPIAIKRLEIAIQQALDMGLLGNNILDSGFSFNVKIKPGAGAFVCGEETALLSSIEGGRGEPVPRPPFPAVKGLWGKPTIINNVETLANIPQILLRGAAWFASMGTEKSKGSKVFALGGKVKNVGLIEVPMGITLREVIEEVGGGIPDGKKFKAAQTGGPSGGCIPESHYDTEVDFDHLIELGSMMGSGGLIVMDEDNCMVDIAKFFLEFTVDESCGKCTPCRVGTKRLYEMLEKITQGKGTMDDIAELESLSHFIKENSLCGLGQTAPNPVLSTLHYFKDEYIEHIQNNRCPAKVCTDLVQYVITDKCIGCGICAKECPVNCISGERREKHVIDQAACIKCGVCLAKCPPRIGAIELI